MSKSICSACREIFNSVGIFDDHRVGGYGDAIYKQSESGKKKEVVGYTKPTRRCLTVEEMQAKGWLKNDKGWWIRKAYDPKAHQEDESDEQEATDE